MDGSIEKRVDWSLIRYANCWEDAGLLCDALQPAPGRRMLSIASGGDNCFALLAAGAEVVAADLNPAQLACVALKVAAIRALDHSAFLQFLGIRASATRTDLYRQLRGELPAEARAYWDRQPEVIAAGLVHAGKFERYFQLFRTRVVPLVHRRTTVQRLFEPRDRSGRVAFYDRTWNNRRWRLLFRVFFSRFLMGRLGRDPELFRYVEGSVADRILARTKYALTELPTQENPYLAYILDGNFTCALPPYLQPQTYEKVRAGLDRLSLHQGTIEEVGRANAGPGFDGFNLSDIFEYLDPAACTAVYGRLLDVARLGARFAYWNMLVPRRVPESLRDQVNSLDDLAARCFSQDRAFFYSAFVVEEKRA
jgi:S-adenosylmethionine-diacylglycerol 3-amino-3-carboxypropyl transferase